MIGLSSRHLTLLLVPLLLLVSCAAPSGSVSNPTAVISTPTDMPTPVPPTIPPTLVAGASRTDAHGVEQVWVPAGMFKMGTDKATVTALRAMNPPSWVARELTSEEPQHQVTLTSGYWIDKYEVTNAAFQSFVEADGYRTQGYWSEAGWQWLSKQRVESLPRSCGSTAPDLPRACITWYEAEAYAHWRGGRLPTEAEWEYAARGPQSSIYPWGNDFDAARCNVVDSKGSQPVGSYPAGVSWAGAHDMAGNVMEWVQDWLDVNYYTSGAATDPHGPETGKIKVEKGGWWGSNLFVARSAYRHYEDPPDYNDWHIGFRIVTP
jgi:formylglycine-generating enzyme required for sulfatase activity